MHLFLIGQFNGHHGASAYLTLMPAVAILVQL